MPGIQAPILMCAKQERNPSNLQIIIGDTEFSKQLF